MSTRTALTVVGGVVGAYFGYPQLGLVVGGLIGGAVDPQVIPGPKIGEIAAQTSADGIPRPIIYGTMACYGNILQTGPAVKVEGDDGGGKGEPEQGTGDQVFRTYAIRICEGPVGGIVRVWQDNKLVYDVRPNSPIPQDSTRWLSNKIFYLGDEDQLPDPTLVASVNADTPSYRGTCYIVFNTEDLTSRTGSIPQYRFEVAVNLEPPEISDISDSATIPVYVSGGNPYHPHIHLTYAQPGDAGEVMVGTCLFNGVNGTTNANRLLSYDRSCTVVATADILLNPASFASAVPTPASGHFPFARSGQLLASLGSVYSSGQIFYLSSAGNLVSVLVPDALSAINWFASNSGQAHASTPRYMWMTQSHLYMGIPDISGVAYNKIHIWTTLPGFAPDYRVNAIATINNICSVPAAQFLMHFGRDGKLRVINDLGVLSTYSTLGIFESSETLPFSIANITGFAVDAELAAFTSSASGGQLIIRGFGTWNVISTYAAAVLNTKPLNNRLVFTDDSLFIQAQNTLLRSDYTSSLIGEPAILADIVADIHDRCNIDSSMYDVSELTDQVDGFMLASDYTGADAISSPQLVYFYDKSEHDKELYYPKRGAAVIETLTVDDLTEVPDTTDRQQAIEIPKKLHLKYQHADAGYPPVKATISSSSPDLLTTGEVTIEVPIVLDEDQAIQTADKMYKITRSELYGKTEIVVPLNIGAKYVNGNCIGLSLRGSTKRYRITQMVLTPDWTMKLTLTPDRQSAYTSNLTGVPVPEPTPPPSTIVGQTELAILDIPARVDFEDDLNYLVAVSGSLPPWYGARYQRSFDAGANYSTVEDITTASIMGVLLDTVTDASEYFTDTTNVVNVDLYRAGQSLSSITLEQFLSEGNGFALEKADGSWEIMQFLDALENSDGSWSLSTLHRGQLNSGTSEHLAGTRFVMLQRPTHIPAQAAWIGQSITHRAITLGESADDTVNYVTHTFVGRSQIEWPVASLEVERDGTDISATWQPRHRFGTGNAPVASVNFQGFRVTIDDGVDSVSFDTTNRFFVDYDASALGSPVTVSVSSLNRITGAGPATSGSV